MPVFQPSGAIEAQSVSLLIGAVSQEGHRMSPFARLSTAAVGWQMAGDCLKLISSVLSVGSGYQWLPSACPHMGLFHDLANIGPGVVPIQGHLGKRCGTHAVAARHVAPLIIYVCGCDVASRRKCLSLSLTAVLKPVGCMALPEFIRNNGCQQALVRQAYGFKVCGRRQHKVAFPLYH